MSSSCDASETKKGRHLPSFLWSRLLLLLDQDKNAGLVCGESRVEQAAQGRADELIELIIAVRTDGLQDISPIDGSQLRQLVQTALQRRASLTRTTCACR